MKTYWKKTRRNRRYLDRQKQERNTEWVDINTTISTCSFHYIMHQLAIGSFCYHTHYYTLELKRNESRLLKTRLKKKNTHTQLNIQRLSKIVKYIKDFPQHSSIINSKNDIQMTKNTKTKEKFDLYFECSINLVC